MTISTGLWWDYSKSGASAATLTLSIQSGGYLLSFLALLVTIAGTSTWSIVAFCLHTVKSHQRQGSESTHPIDFMHRVSLRNSGSGISTFWKIVKNHRDWARMIKNPLQANSAKKSAMIAIPALLVWVGFAVAVIFTSNVANKAYGTTFARLQDDHCGVWRYNTTTTEGNELQRNKEVNDTMQARNYASNFYVNTSTQEKLSRSTFVQEALPYTTDTNVTCPWGTKKCLRRQNGTMRAYTPLLDSHTMFGMNALPQDRIRIQINMTCSPITTQGYVKPILAYDNATFTGYYMGEVQGGIEDSTYTHYDDSQRTGMGYMIRTQWAYAKKPETSSWNPLPEFTRTDADVSIYFLSQNAIAYSQPVYDPWFAATGIRTMTDDNGNNATFCDYLVNVMVCTHQYIICNPTNSVCTPPLGRFGLQDMVLSGDNAMNLTLAQGLTAGRLMLGLIDSSSFNVVKNIGVGALWANSRLIVNTLSPGLPANQWQIEALGWFQTSLAGLQGWIAGYPTSDVWNSPHAADPGEPAAGELGKATTEACRNQLVRTAGEVQNFDFVAVMVICVISCVLILVDLVLESTVNLIGRWRGWGSVSRQARQTDDQLHLLRMVLNAEAQNHDHGHDHGQTASQTDATEAPVICHPDSVNHAAMNNTQPSYTTEVNTDSSEK